MKQSIFAVLALLALGACQNSSPPPSDATGRMDQAGEIAAPVTPRSMPTPDPEAVAGDRIDLRPMTSADLVANPLDGELGCSFVASGGSGALLIASGVVAVGTTIRGIVKPGDDVERVGAAGDYGALARGLSLTGRGIDVTLTRGAAHDDATEQTTHDATLQIERADGSRRSYAGTWTCGP